MKNLLRISLLFIFVLAFQNTNAQGVEITTSYGYQFGSKLNYGPNYLKIDDSDQYGITLGYEVRSGLMAEISYIHHGTELRIRDRVVSPGEERLSDLSADWFQVGASKYFQTGKVRPFAGGGMGLLFLAPKNENRDIISGSLENRTKFAFSFKGGVNIMLSEVVGINLQANLLFPVEWGGVYIGAGTGGVSSGAALSSTTIIAGFSGGLVFKLGS